MEATVVGHRVLQELHRRGSLLVGVEVVLRAGIEGSNSSHEAMAAANQLVDRFQRSTQGVQATELMRQWRESSSHQWARSHNQRGLESIESNWREAEELHQRAEHTLQHAEVYRRAAENAQRLVQQGRTDLTTGIAQFAYATGRGAMVETLDPIAQRRNLNALRLEYLGRGGFLADGAFVPSIDALGAGTGRSAREQLGATEARLGTEASATASFDGVRSQTIADPLAQRSRTERSVRAAQAGAGVDPRRSAGEGAAPTRELRAIEQRLEAGQRDTSDRAERLQSGVRQSTDNVHEALRDAEVRGAAGQTEERPSVLRQLLAPLQRWSRGGWFGEGK